LKIRIEWPEESGRFRETRVAVGFSRLGNYYATFEGKVFVWNKQAVGEVVISKVNGEWRPVGRVTINGLFIGPATELCYAEWSRTSQGKAKLEADFQQFRSDLASFRNSLQEPEEPLIRR
jgi:hypothetical protein